MSKKQTYKLEGDMTYMQCRRISHIYATQNADLYPEYGHKKLAQLFHGSIYYYHEKSGVKLSKAEASDIIKNETPCKQIYIDELNIYMKNPNKTNKINKSTNTIKSGNKSKITGIEDLPRE